jgi:hypothetical protein
MAQRTDNWIDKIAKLIPGYAGYKAKEERRDTDRALRQVIVTRLDDRRMIVDRVIAECSRQMKFDALEPLEALRRRLQLLSDMVRYAPAGYSGFFDTFEVKQADLELIYGHDLRVREEVENLGSLIASLDSTSANLSRDADAAAQSAAKVEEMFRARDKVVTGID